MINIKQRYRERNRKMTEIVLYTYLALSFGYAFYVVFSNREQDSGFAVVVLLTTLVVTFNYLGIL